MTASLPHCRRYLKQRVDDQFTIGYDEIARFGGRFEAEHKCS